MSTKKPQQKLAVERHLLSNIELSQFLQRFLAKVSQYSRNLTGIRGFRKVLNPSKTVARTNSSYSEKAAGRPTGRGIIDCRRLCKVVFLTWCLAAASLIVIPRSTSQYAASRADSPDGCDSSDSNWSFLAVPCMAYATAIRNACAVLMFSRVMSVFSSSA